MKPAEVYRLTLREFGAYVAGVNRQRRESFRERITAAYLGVSLSRRKRLPKLATLLPREERKMTAEQRKAHIWNVLEAFANPGELKETKRHGRSRREPKGRT